MMTPAIYRIVDAQGTVHHANLTSAQADAFMSVMLAGSAVAGLRSERMDQSAPVESDSTPALVAALAAEAALSRIVASIEPGSEREHLREAIAAHRQATGCKEQAGNAVERAKAFLSARQLELDVLTAARANEIQSSGANLAEALKSGVSVLETERPIDTRAVTDAEVRRDTARAALERLQGEQQAAEAAYRAAESAVRLAVAAVKRADVEAMCTRLIDVKAEYLALAAAVEGSRFSDVPATLETNDAVRLEPLPVTQIDASAHRWHAYGAALRENADATWEHQ